jgi:tetratricopeptide (TPR) repeat protein
MAKLRARRNKLNGSFLFTEVLMRRFSWLAILLLVICNTTLEAQTSEAARDYVKRGIARFSKGDVDGAIGDYDKALEISPRLAEAHLNRGKARRAKGKLDEAIEDYEKVMELDPRLTSNNRDIAQAYTNRGFIRTNNFDLDGALSDFDKAIEVAPTDADSYIKRGEAHLIKGDLQDAVADFDKGITLNPGKVSASLAYAGRGFTRLLQGNDAEAQKDLEKSIQLNREGRIFIELHLKILEAQIRELRRRRSADQQPIASDGPALKGRPGSNALRPAL